MTTDPVPAETVEVEGHNLLSKIKELIHEGNVRRLTITSEGGETLIQVPLTVGVVGALLVPTWAAIGAVAAIVTKAKIEIERVDDTSESATDDTGDTPETDTPETDTPETDTPEGDGDGADEEEVESGD
jgi:cytoskeletal protein RodZ